MDYLYKGRNLHDLALHREFTRAYANATGVSTVVNIYLSIMLIFIMHHFDLAYCVGSFLFIAAIFLVSTLISGSKKGDIQYRRMLQANNGEPRREALTFRESGIRMVNEDNGNCLDFTYDQFRRIIESENLLIFVMKYRSCLILRKDSLEGGTIPELIAFLGDHCVNLKNNAPQKTGFGKWVRRILTLIIITGSIWALLNLPFYSVMDHLLGRLDNSMSYEQMAEVLKELDVHISQRAIDEMNQYDADYLSENSEYYYDDAFRYQKVSDLLYWEAAGFYNEMKDQWQYSTSGVFWQDYHMEDIPNVYPDFFSGLAAMDETFAFSNIQVNLSQEAIDLGYGTAEITFQWQSNDYSVDIDYSSTFFDETLVPQIAKIVNSNDQKLFISTDRSDGIFFYYGSTAQVKTLERYANLHFKDASKSVW